jgi:hypothetical protein
MAQVVETLPSKCKALSSNPHCHKKKKKTIPGNEFKGKKSSQCSSAMIWAETDLFPMLVFKLSTVYVRHTGSILIEKQKTYQVVPNVFTGTLTRDLYIEIYQYRDI